MSSNTTCDFTPPPRHLRDRYTTRTTRRETRPGCWSVLDVEVLDLGPDAHTELDDDARTAVHAAADVVAHYERAYPSLYATFEPFSQASRPYALISTDYTRTTVLDLTSGHVIANEPPPPLVTLSDGREVKAAGFCPVEFFVPDWWDVHDETVLPPSKYFDPLTDTLPDGSFGLVAGCFWGDDSSWKVQYLDLSRIGEGIVQRDDRFGYVELPSAVQLKDAVRYSPDTDTVDLAVSVPFSRTSGCPDADTLDGLVAPDTRQFSRTTDPSSLDAQPIEDQS